MSQQILPQTDALQAWTERMDHFLRLGRAERLHQLRKWGPQKHSLPIWSAILSEEVGELSQQILRQTFNPKDKPTDMGHLVEEAIQVAAVALAIAQCAEDGEA